MVLMVMLSSGCYFGPDGAKDGEPVRVAGGESEGGEGESGAEDEGSGPDAAPEPDPPPSHDAASDLECDVGLAPSPWLKLSTMQYRNTVRDLLRTIGAQDVIPSVDEALASIPDDSQGEDFRGLDDRISQEHVLGYFGVSKAIAESITGDDDALGTYVGGCATDDPLTEACVQEFVETLGLRAYRRPLTMEERDALLSLHDGARDSAAVFRAITIVILNSPHFVSHVELGGAPSDDDGELFDLSPFELASRLSYTFWQTMPDDELLAAAADGSLATEAGFLAQVERVFEDSRTRDTLWDFWREWLKLEKFTGFETSRPGFQALLDEQTIDGRALYEDMMDEIRTLTELYTFDEPSTLATLMETPISVTESPELAALYGVPAWNGTDEYPVFEGGERGGLFQRAALLANALETTNPFHRGSFIRRNLLCDILPQPDPNSLPPGALDPPPFDPAQSTRQRYAAKVDDNPLCSGCHTQFSDLGYVMEAYDPLGRYRREERVFDEQTGEVLAVLPIDLSTTPRVETSDATEIDSVQQLNEAMIASGKVDRCLAQNFYRYVMRRALATDTADTCARDDLTGKIRDADVGLAQAFKDVVRYPSFLQRKVGPR